MSDSYPARDPIVQTQLDKSHGKIFNPALDYESRTGGSIHDGRGGLQFGGGSIGSGVGSSNYSGGNSGAGAMLLLCLGICCYFMGWIGIPVALGVMYFRAYLGRLLLAGLAIGLLLVGLAWLFPTWFEKAPSARLAAEQAPVAAVPRAATAPARAPAPVRSPTVAAPSDNPQGSWLHGTALSFPCAGASSPGRQRICATPELAALDRSLGRLYGTAYDEATAAKLDLDQPDIKAFKAQHKDWLAARDSCDNEQCLRTIYSVRHFDLCALMEKHGLTACEG